VSKMINMISDVQQSVSKRGIRDVMVMMAWRGTHLFKQMESTDSILRVSQMNKFKYNIDDAGC